jgi:hypothetical protein
MILGAGRSPVPTIPVPTNPTTQGNQDHVENQCRAQQETEQGLQLDRLASAAAIDIYQSLPTTASVHWPWKSQREFHRRLREAHVHFRRSHPASEISPAENLRFVGFRPDEASFLLCWFQENWDWCSSNEECGKGWRYHPTCRLVRDSLPSLGYGGYTLVRFSLALFDELGLNQYEAAALPLDNVHPSIPWKTIDQFYTRLRDVDAFGPGSHAAKSVSSVLLQIRPRGSGLRYKRRFVQRRPA